MPGTLSPYPRLQFFDNNGLPLDGGRLYTYTSGTDVPRAVYTNATLSTAHPNPALLDGAGRITLYLVAGQAYKFILKDKNDVFVWEVDPVSVASGALSGGGGGGGEGGSTLDVLGTAGVDLAPAQPVYFDLDGRWYPARGDDASKSTNARLVGMTVRAMARNERDTICLWGFVEYGPLVAGVAYYIAPTGGIGTAAAGARLIGYGDYDGHSLIVVQPTFQGTAPVTQPTPPPVGTAFQAQCLLVAGGGGGGKNKPGVDGFSTSGGGAGGLFDVVVSLTPGTTYTGVVGAGGAGGTNGGDSSLTGTAVTLLVHGGGHGGGYDTVGQPGLGDGTQGGSGGGSQFTGGAGYPGEGNSGGSGGGTGVGGGGGKGAPGGTTFGTSEGRSGGPGYPSSINGAAITYACGGGGAYPFAFIENGNGGGGGLGGGGNGAHRIDNVPATPGSTPGSGGGGGDTKSDLTLMPPGAGANGTCIIRYAGAARCTGGNITSSAGYTIHTFGVGAISLVVT